MTVPTYVFQPFAFEGMQLMVELWPDGRVTVALRHDVSAAWGPKHDPIISDDGDHIRTPEPLSDEAFANYLDGLSKGEK